MRLGGEINDKIGIILGKNLVHSLGIVNVCMNKNDRAIGNFVRNIVYVSGISERVNHNYSGIAAMRAQNVFYEVGAYESCAAGNKIGLFHQESVWFILWNSLQR